MTEDEAKTKWCPFARVSDLLCEHPAPSPSYNRIVSEYEDGTAAVSINRTLAVRCIGSACMAWQWTKPHFTIHRLNQDGTDAYSFPADSEVGFGNTAEFRIEAPSVANGHCGLAGAPS